MSNPTGSGQLPDKLSVEQRELIIKRLEGARVRLPCPRCANTNFQLEPTLAMVPLQPYLRGPTRLGGPTIPAAITVCDRCGFLSFHALGALQLLDHPLFVGDKR